METPTYEKLDRVLASVEWERKYPLVTVRAQPKGISDHTPLLMDSEAMAHVGNKPAFLFEISWFEREVFFYLVATEWSQENRGCTPTDIWQNKVRHLPQFFRGWAKSASRVYKKEKGEASRSDRCFGC